MISLLLLGILKSKKKQKNNSLIPCDVDVAFRDLRWNDVAKCQSLATSTKMTTALPRHKRVIVVRHVTESYKTHWLWSRWSHLIAICPTWVTLKKTSANRLIRYFISSPQFSKFNFDFFLTFECSNWIEFCSVKLIVVLICENWGNWLHFIMKFLVRAPISIILYFRCL